MAICTIKIYKIKLFDRSFVEVWLAGPDTIDFLSLLWGSPDIRTDASPLIKALVGFFQILVKTLI